MLGFRGRERVVDEVIVFRFFLVRVVVEFVLLVLDFFGSGEEKRVWVVRR